MTFWQDNAIFNVSRLSYLLENGVNSDVTFVVGEEPGQRFSVHKLVLAMWSKTFNDMLYDPESQMDEIRIPDFRAAAFEIAMRYIYEELFTVRSMEDAMETYLLTEKYGIEQLRKRCLNYMNENLYPENIPILFTMPTLLDRLQLKSKCLTVLSEKTSAVLRSTRFLTAPVLMIEEMLRMDELDVENESEVFEFVLSWARAECLRQGMECLSSNLRGIMDLFLPHIRFLSMSMEQFYSGPVHSEILSDSEVAAISANLMRPGTRNLPSFCSLEKPRNVLRSFRLIDYHSCNFADILVDSVECAITLMNGSMTLRGVSVHTVFGQPFEGTTAPFTITRDSESVMFKAQYSYDVHTKVLKCLLLEPLELSPSSEYTLSVRSDSSVFQKCCQLMPSCFLRRHRNLELKCVLKDPLGFTAPGRDGLLNGCSHFHEIFYS